MRRTVEFHYTHLIKLRCSQGRDRWIMITRVSPRSVTKNHHNPIAHHSPPRVSISKQHSCKRTAISWFYVEKIKTTFIGEASTEVKPDKASVFAYFQFTHINFRLPHINTYDHRYKNTGLPVWSAVLKLVTGWLVLRWVTTRESQLLYVFKFFISSFLAILVE